MTLLLRTSLHRGGRSKYDAGRGDVLMILDADLTMPPEQSAGVP
jgi:hypothetical protein